MRDMNLFPFLYLSGFVTGVMLASQKQIDKFFFLFLESLCRIFDRIHLWNNQGLEFSFWKDLWLQIQNFNKYEALFRSFLLISVLRSYVSKDIYLFHLNCWIFDIKLSMTLISLIKLRSLKQQIVILSFLENRNPKSRLPL